MFDTPPSSLMDSIVSPKVEDNKKRRSWGALLVCNISRVKGCVGALKWGLGRLTSKSIIHMDLHKPNNKLVNV
jgi:hypothetical protein